MGTYENTHIGHGIFYTLLTTISAPDGSLCNDRKCIWNNILVTYLNINKSNDMENCENKFLEESFNHRDEVL